MNVKRKLTWDCILGLESRLKYAVADRVTTTSQIETNKTEIKKLELKLEKFAPASTEIAEKIKSRDTAIQELKERVNSVEDTVFSDFCAQIGVANIRQYEERELRFVSLFYLYSFSWIWWFIHRTQQERAKKRLEFDNQKNRILNLLEFEKSRNTQSNYT